MAVNDRRYGLIIICCYRVQNGNPAEQQYLASHRRRGGFATGKDGRFSNIKFILVSGYK